jgi:hypothetical protein
MKAKLCLFLCAFLLLAALPGMSYDFGGKIDNATSPTVSSGNVNLLQEDKLALWVETALGENLKLTVQGSFTLPYTYSFSAESGDTGATPFLNLDLLTVEGEKLLGSFGTRRLSYTLGRFAAADFSGYLFDDTLDGLTVGWQQALFNATLTAGYTGLQFQPYSSVRMSGADAADTLYTEDDPLGDKLAPPRLIGLLAFEFPELMGRQDLRVTLAAQQDLRDKTELLAEGDTVKAALNGPVGRLSTQYLGAGLRGNLAPALYADLFVYLGSGRMLSWLEDAYYEYRWMLSALAGGSVRWFREDLLSSRAELKLLFASGDADFETFLEGNREELATAFQTISRPELALVFSPVLSNLAVLEASYSVKPAAALQVLVKAFAFLRPAAGPVSDSRVDPAGEADYLGSEIDLALRWRPYSDLGLACSAGIFLPAEAAFLAGAADPELQGRIEISFSF